jgi:alpha-1,2-mannosyltransferase
VVWTYWRRRDPVLSVALLITAIFVVSPYSLSYDLVVLGWVVALLRQREDMQPTDHYLLMAVWVLPAAMLLNTELKIPTAAIVLSAFAARLVWRLAQEETAQQQTSSDPEPARTANPDLVAAPAFARARTLHGWRVADWPLPSNWPRT